MNKVFKTILIISITVFVGCLMSASTAKAENMSVEVWNGTNFEPLAGRPIFDIDNFLPGDTAPGKIRVNNFTPENQTVGLDIVDFDRGCVGAYCLADDLYLTVGESGNGPLYSGSLTSFYGAGKVPLSEVGAEASVQYDLSVYFNETAAEEEYQEAITSFNLQIGFFTKETVSEEPATGGGGYTPPLVSGVVTIISITGPSILTSDSATVSCDTDISSYCRVIYDDESHPVLEEPPNYGYELSTEPTVTKTISHEITLTNLEPGTTYFYRIVCWGSPAKISREYSFTTLGPEQEEAAEQGEEVIKETEETERGIVEATSTEVVIEEIVSEEEGWVAGVETEDIGKEKEEEEKEEGEGLTAGFNKLLAAIGSFFSGNIYWLFLFAIVVLIVLFLLSGAKKRKREEEKDKSYFGQ